jgi:hypothetical protein
MATGIAQHSEKATPVWTTNRSEFNSLQAQEIILYTGYGAHLALCPVSAVGTFPWS